MILLAIGPIVGQLLPADPIARTSSTVFDLLATPDSVVRWIAMAIAVLGVFELAWPMTQADGTPARETMEQPSAA